uniref:Uncharacterized protein n=1 Tax=Macaca mulatta TaxID=9544 RepID=A0A5F7ZSG4_MACMU
MKTKFLLSFKNDPYFLFKFYTSLVHDGLEILCNLPPILLIALIAWFILSFFFFLDRVLLCHPGWSAVQCSAMQCSGVIMAHCNLQFLSSSYSPASATRVDGITDVHHHAQLIFVFLVEIEFHHVAQAGLKLLTSNDPSASASQSAGITDVSQRASLGLFLKGSGETQLHQHLPSPILSSTSFPSDSFLCKLLQRSPM